MKKEQQKTPATIIYDIIIPQTRVRVKYNIQDLVKYFLSFFAYFMVNILTKWVWSDIIYSVYYTVLL